MSEPDAPSEADIKYLESAVGKKWAVDVAWVLFDTGTSVRDEAAVQEALYLVREVG